MSNISVSSGIQRPQWTYVKAPPPPPQIILWIGPGTELQAGLVDNTRKSWLTGLQN